MVGPTVEEILNRSIVTTNPLRKALIKEFDSKGRVANRSTIEKFAAEVWGKYPKLRGVYKKMRRNKEDLFDDLMDELRLSYE